MKKFIKYARKEPTTDDVVKKYGQPEKVYDVQLYDDRAAKHPYARFVWNSSAKPTRRNKRVVVNCFTWTLKWLPDIRVRKNLSIVTKPKLVIEYHYADGDIGAYPAGGEAQKLWEGFAANPLYEPTKIVIRPETPGGD